MYGELTAITEPGRRFVALAEEHAADFATRAAEHDRDGTFPTENFQAMQESGFLAGPVPEEFGGLGVFSIHDMGVAMSRLARGDGSCAIAANMHLTSVHAQADCMPARRRVMMASASLITRSISSFTVGTSWMSPATMPHDQAPALTSPSFMTRG